MKTKFKVPAGAVLTGVALVCVAGFSSSCTRPRPSALKPIDQAALQTMVDTTARELRIPGAFVLLRTPQGEFTVSHGTTLLGANNPPRADTHFRIASNTKTMTAAEIVLLAQENKLSLDDPVSKYVPGVPDGDNITIKELLNMRSGLYTYDDNPDFWAVLERDPTKIWSPAEVLAIAFKHPLYFPPGTDFHYSNTNYTLLGLIAEKIEGKPLASCFQDRLFGPLGLKNTLLPATTSNTLPDPYSHGYLYGGCSFRNLTDKPYPPEIQAAVSAGTLKPDDCTEQNSSYASAAGVSSRRRKIVPPGFGHWSATGCLMPTINASGLTACSPRLRASPKAKSTGTASVNLAGDRTRFIFMVARCPVSTRKSATTQPTS